MQCDLRSGTCGQCLRARVTCLGYRDTQQLRIRNESDAVVRKALKNVSPFIPHSLPLSVDLEVHGAFFAYYVPSTSKYWEFLKRYYRPTNPPDHLTLAIEAVSLAYLWHQVYSDAVLAAARERYVSALRMTNKSLRSYKEATKDTTLLTALLLDVFEKITDSERQNNTSWLCHVDGGLALVKHRGLENFQDPTSIRILVRLSTNYVISCIANGSPLLEELIAIRSFIEKHLNVQDPNWRLSEIMVDYAKLRSEIKRGTLTGDECSSACMAFDVKLQTFDLEMPPSWQHSTTLLNHRSEKGFDLHYDSYPDRNVTQGRNGLRVLRILLNESLLEHYLASPTHDKYLESIKVAHENIGTLGREICASVPQYVDCDGAAQQRLPTSDKTEFLNQIPNHTLGRRPGGGCGHSHTPTHRLDCYTLIFPLYAAGRSNSVPDIRPWVIKQLRYISSHFYVRIAEDVAQILEQGTDVSPWNVYTMLGSYAFAA